MVPSPEMIGTGTVRRLLLFIPRLRRPRAAFPPFTSMSSTAVSTLRAGVLFGDEVQQLFDYAKEQGFALPAVNVTGTDTVNAVLEAARELNSPVIIQFSNGGAQFFAGKG